MLNMRLGRTRLGWGGCSNSSSASSRRTADGGGRWTGAIWLKRGGADRVRGEEEGTTRKRGEKDKINGGDGVGE